MAEQTYNKVTKSELNRMWWIWIFFNLSSFSMERMQSMAFVYMMSPILRKYYGNDPEGMKDALKRHMVFFNTEPQTGVIANGVATALEEQKANGSPIEDDAINAVKAGIMGPMAGIGDAMIPGTLIPILLGIGIGLSGTDGSPIGPIFYAVSYLIIILLLSYWLFTFGYRYGMETMARAGRRRFPPGDHLHGSPGPDRRRRYRRFDHHPEHHPGLYIRTVVRQSTGSTGRRDASAHPVPAGHLAVEWHAQPRLVDQQGPGDALPGDLHRLPAGDHRLFDPFAELPEIFQPLVTNNSSKNSEHPV